MLGQTGRKPRHGDSCRSMHVGNRLNGKTGQVHAAEMTVVAAQAMLAGLMAVIGRMPVGHHRQRCALERLAVIGCKFQRSGENREYDSNCDKLTHGWSLAHGSRTVQSLQPGMRPSAAVVGVTQTVR